MKLDTIKDISAIISSIVLPLVIFVIGQRFTSQQAEATEERASFDRMTEVLKSFSSDRPKERMGALDVLDFYATKCEFPAVLLPTLEGGVQDEDEEIAAKSFTIGLHSVQVCPTNIYQGSDLDPDTAAWVEQVSASHPGLVQGLDFKRLNFPPVIIITIQTEDRRPDAQEVRTDFQDGFGILIEKRKLDSADSNVVKYFHDEDKTEALDIAKMAHELGKGTIEAELFSAQVAPPRYYELYLPSSSGEPKQP